MRYYLKIGANSKILNPGDFFVGADGLNHNYNEVVTGGPSDRAAMGVHELDESAIDYEAVYSPSNMQLRELEETKAMRMLDQFAFRQDYYTATVRDLSTINILLTIATLQQTDGLNDIGNLMWFNENVPFFWHTADGNIRNMDIPTFKDFAKSMAEHIMTHHVCAAILKHRIQAGEEVDIMSVEHWPSSQRTNKENYEFFTELLISTKYGDDRLIDESYQTELDAIAGMIE